MGCDIHMRAEIRQDSDSPWEAVGKVFKNTYYRPNEENQIDEDGFEWNPPLINQPYRGRNYDFFAILADVRNGRGFAGIKTGEGFNPISEPKGYPMDASSEIMKWMGCEVDDGDYPFRLLQDWVDKGLSEWIIYGKLCTNPDYHSASYFTVKELQDYDWDQLTMKRGIITFDQFKALKEDETAVPTSWSGGIIGPNISVIYEDVAGEILSTNKRPIDLVGKNLYVEYHWCIKYREHALGFLNETVPDLLKLGEPDNVRIIFAFDN